MNTKITLKIEELEAIVKAAKEQQNDNHNGFVEIVLEQATKYHAKSDKATAWLQSGWAECNPTKIYSNKS
ncbi:MAG: hypothetical protein LBC68_12925 [Prevotellaceae bacterium]|jgi:hypothetical protein|nr:hypothetical protein [Prevotellaceae bacterium]